MKDDNGFIDSIWRYLVKSMAGESLGAAQVTPRGVLGDRVYALVDRAANRAATVRTWAAPLLSYRAEFVAEPQIDAPPRVRITSPDGITLMSTQAGVDQRFSEIFHRDLSLMSTAPPGLLVEFPAGTLGGALSHVTEAPLASAAPAGSFFDVASVHLIATSTLDFLQAAYPKGQFDIRRFRPNILVRSQGEPFIENSWLGRTLALGDDVLMRVTIPCPRCVNTNLPQSDLPNDPGILRTIAQHNMRDLGDFGRLPCAGVYADVIKAGSIRCGDAIRIVD